MNEIVVNRKYEERRQYSTATITAEELNKVVERVKSTKLAKIIARIIVKLMEALTSRIEKLMATVGRGIARKHAELACSWGYTDALKWAEDPDFIRYLTILEMNKMRRHGFRR